VTIIIPANSAADTAFSVANSCRFNDGDSPHMTKTPSAGDVDKWTFSCWVKRCTLGSQQVMLSGLTDSNNYTLIRFEGTDQLQFYNVTSASVDASLKTNRLFRDVSAWYHIVCVWDSANGTAGDRMKMYINGVEETSFATDTNPSSGLNSHINAGVAHYVGQEGDGSKYFDGYLAEMVFSDGQALAATSFGEFDEDSPTIWKPINVSGLTFGTNGFYLDFEASDNLGNDANGGTDLAETNLAAADQATDTPTNNFATVNPLDNYYQGHAFSQGNCKVTSTNSDTSFHTSTFAVSSGKWYAEVKVDGTDDSGGTTNVGIAGKLSTSTTNYIGADAQHFAYRANEGNKETGGSNSSYGSGWGDNALIGIYLDLDNNKLYFSEDGTLQNSGTGISITAPASVDMGAYVMGAGDRHTGAHIDLVWNFGGCPSFTVSSAVADDNGYGSFEYSPNITGDSVAKSFYALNTKNLAEFGG
jgi:hypothetical protein